MKSPEQRSRERAAELAAIGALLGVSVLAVLQLVQMPLLSPWLDFAVYAFAVAIPLLATSVHLLTTAHVRQRAEPLAGIPSLPGPLGALAAVAGLGACIAHHHVVAGLVFWAVGVACFAGRVQFSVRIGRGEKPGGTTSTTGVPEEGDLGH